MLKDKINIALVLGIAVCGVLLFFSSASAVQAQPTSINNLQKVQAQYDISTAINICQHDYLTPIGTITFPLAAPSSEVSNPGNGTDTQTFGIGGAGIPVATLVNTAAVPYTIWYNITTFTNGVVSSESYVIVAKGGDCADAAAINQAVTFGTDTTTGITIAATGTDAAKKDLYLKVNLSAVAGKSGTSTITILGETS